MRYGMRRWRRAADRDMHIHEIMTWCCGWHNRAPTVAQLTIKCRPLQGKVTYRRRVKPHHEHVSFDKWGVRSRDRAGKGSERKNKKDGKVNPTANCVSEHPLTHFERGEAGGSKKGGRRMRGQEKENKTAPSLPEPRCATACGGGGALLTVTCTSMRS